MTGKGRTLTKGSQSFEESYRDRNVATNIKSLIILRGHVVMLISLDCHLLMKVRISERRWTS